MAKAIAGVGDRWRLDAAAQVAGGVLVGYACASSQLVVSRVAPLRAEQTDAGHAGAVLRFVH